MKFISSLLIFLSLIFIQIHGITHQHHDESTGSDHCVVCSIVNYGPTFVPTLSSFEVSFPYQIAELIFLSKRSTFAKTSVRSLIQARAPPFYS